MSPPASAHSVSTILRLHDPERLDRLELALFSLCGQRHSYLSPVVVLQDFDDEAEEAVRRMAARLPWRAQTRPPDILNLRGLGKGDHRAKLLNAGVKAATGAYVAFLDFDDYLYPNAYSLLLERIAESGKVAAFGTVAIAEMDPDSPAGACLTKRAFPQNRAKYDFFNDNSYPIHSFVMRSDVAQSVIIPDQLCALEDYYFLLAALKDHDWDDELTKTRPIADYVYWSDQSNTIAGTAGLGASGRPWKMARRYIDRYKQDLVVKIPLRRLLALAEQGHDTTAEPSQPLDFSAAFLRTVRSFLPLVSLWRRLEGGIDQAEWNGSETNFSGTVSMPKWEPSPVGGLLFLSRPSRLRPSYRHLATIGFDLRELRNNTYSFTGSTRLSAQQMRKGRNQLVLFILTSDGRLYRAPQTRVPSVSSRVSLDDAA